MSLSAALLVVLPVGLVAGAVNSVAGGGTLITFPTLILVGLDPITANATSTLALWPGYVSATAGFHRELSGMRRLLLFLTPPSLAGGIAGAVLLLVTPVRVFDYLAPALILAATVLLTAQDRRPPDPHREHGARSTARLVAYQFGAGVYGGYFGAGLGFVLLVGYGLFGSRDFLRSAGLKNATTVAINGVALAYFLARGAVAWSEGLAMAAGAVVGGYAGAALSRRVGGGGVRKVVVAFGFLVSAVLLARAVAR